MNSKKAECPQVAASHTKANNSWERLWLVSYFLVWYLPAIPITFHCFLTSIIHNIQNKTQTTKDQKTNKWHKLRNFTSSFNFRCISFPFERNDMQTANDSYTHTHTTPWPASERKRRNRGVRSDALFLSVISRMVSRWKQITSYNGAQLHEKYIHSTEHVGQLFYVHPSYPNKC